MLPIMQGLVVPRLTALKEQRITAALFGQRIEAHHQAAADLCVLAEGVRIHRHDPIRRVDPIVTAPCAHVRVTRKNSAVQHEHVIAEHKHASIHRRRIRHPRRAGTLAIHRIGNVD